MKKIKKLALFVSVGLILFTPLSGVVPLLTSPAYAAPANDASVEEQMRTYIYARAIAYCLRESASLVPSEESVDKFDFLGGGDSYIGYLDTGNEDGKEDCNESWVADAYAIWNMGADDPGATPGVSAACYSGYDRTGYEGQDAPECIKGTGYFEANGNPTESFIRNLTRIFYGKEDTKLPGMSKAMEYLYYSQSFLKLCKPTDTNLSIGGGYTSEEVGDNPDLIYMTDPDGVDRVYKMTNKSTGDEVTTRVSGDGTSGGEVKLKCGDLAVNARSDGRPEAYAAAVKDGSAEGLDTGALDGDAEAPEIKCTDSIERVLFNPLNWLACPLVNGFAALASGMEKVIVGMLCINETDIFAGSKITCSESVGDNAAESQEAFYAAWNVFRVIALAFIAIAGLVMVLSQALGFEIVDSYTIKKVLPRIVVAAIGISLSWPLLEFLVTFSNALGIGIRNLIYTPFESVGDVNVLSGGSGALASLFSLGAFAALGVFGLLSFIATAALAIFVAFFVLVIRNILVILLVILAPIAIAMYVLPNTEKYWKIWWEWLFKALMAFPIITAMIAVGHVFAAITSNRDDSALSAFVAFAAYFAPYFLIPAAFRFAGGALATIGGFANDRSRGAFDRLSKFRQNRTADRVSRARSNSLWNNNSWPGRAGNKVAGWGFDPLGNAAYSANQNKYLRRIPGVASAGSSIASSIEHARVEQSTKMFEELNKAGYNDKAYRLLSGAHGGLSKSTQAKLGQAGLLNKQISSLSDLETAAHILGESDEGSERIASTAIHGSAGRLNAIYKDPDFMKADTRAAGLIGLAAHGFADGDDLAVVGNALQGSDGKDSAYAQSVVSQAQVIGARSRPDIKAGYGVVYKDGTFHNGMTIDGPDNRAIPLIKTLQSGDLAGAKGGSIKALETTITSVLGGSAGSGEAKAVQDQLFSWAGPYSQASVGVKADALRIINDRVASDPVFAADWKQYQRGAASNEAHSGGTPGAPEPPAGGPAA